MSESIREPDESGNGVSPSEWRAWMVREIRSQNQALGDLRSDLQPVLDFYQRTLGVLKVVQFVGPVGALGALLGMAWVLGVRPA